MDCKICLDTYDDEQKRPRNLPCGHTFCSLCIEDLIRGGTSTCPNCRKNHGGSCVYDFPYAYDMEELISKMKSLLPTKPQLPALINKLQEEQLANLNKSLSSCSETCGQLKDYRSTISQWVRDHETLISELNNIVKVNISVVDQLKREEETVTLYLREGEEQLQNLKLAKEGNAVDKMMEVVPTLDETECCLATAEEWSRKCLENIPNAQTVYRSVKLRTATKKAINMVTTDIGDVMCPEVEVNDEGGAVSFIVREPFENQCESRIEPAANILQRVDNIIGMEAVTVENLRVLAPPVRLLVESGQVFATHNIEGRPHYARISVYDDFICVHHLEPVPPLANSHILQHSELLRHVDPSAALVFLEVAWPGAPRSRIFIRLSPETERGRQFKLLCTGEQGPSYANTRLLKIFNKGKPGECVKGGDYDKHDGTGGAALILGLTRGGEYTRDNRAGAVWGRWGDECRGAQFYITTRSRSAGVLLTVFGQVEIGLEALRLGIDSPESAHIVVTDCGIVVPR